MKIRGLFRRGAPFFRVRIRSTGVEEAFWLMADTGAGRTTILNRDVDRLGIPGSATEPAYIQMMGISGPVNWSWLRGAELILPTTDGETLIRQDICIVRHQLAGLPLHEAEHILRLPSILGRDIINHFRFVYERATGTVLLER